MLMGMDSTLKQNGSNLFMKKNNTHKGIKTMSLNEIRNHLIELRNRANTKEENRISKLNSAIDSLSELKEVSERNARVLQGINS